MANRARVVRALLAANADPNGGQEGEGLPPLHAACREGERDVVEALLETWVDADAAPCKGKRLLRPLHVAATYGNAAIVEALTLKGCRLDVRTLDPSRWAVLLRLCVGGCRAYRRVEGRGIQTALAPVTFKKCTQFFCSSINENTLEYFDALASSVFERDVAVALSFVVAAHLDYSIRSCRIPRVKVICYPC